MGNVIVQSATLETLVGRGALLAAEVKSIEMELDGVKNSIRYCSAWKPNSNVRPEAKRKSWNI